MKKPSSHQALIDAIVTIAKHDKAAAGDADDNALIIELAGRGLEAPESLSLDDIKALCRRVIAEAVEQVRRSQT